MAISAVIPVATTFWFHLPIVTVIPAGALAGLLLPVWTVWCSRRISSARIAQVYLDAALCPSCGYELADIPADDRGRTRCPECGGAWARFHRS